MGADQLISDVTRIDESLIERYVRFPETLSEEDRHAVEEYLAQNKYAAEIADFYRAFYEELDALKKKEKGTDSEEEGD